MGVPVSPVSNVRVAGGCFSAQVPLPDGGQAISYVDNALLTHGRPEPLAMPEVWPTPIPDHSRFLARHKGEWFFTKERRDMVVHADASGEQLVWTEAGAYPTKRVGTTVVGLGLSRPGMPPQVKSLGSSCVSSVAGTLQNGSGSHPAERTRYVRIAYETKEGVLPPSPAGSVIVSTFGQSISWSWVNVPQIQDVVRIMVFAGYTKGEEIHVASLNPGTSTWLDLGTAVDSGVMAIDYEMTGTYQYAYTVVRQVEGFIDESGPSPVSQRISGNTVREVTISQETENLMDGMPDVTTWGVNDGGWQILGSKDFEGYAHNVIFLQESGVGLWSVDLAGEHDFFKDEAVVFKGKTSDDATPLVFRATVKQVQNGNRLQLDIEGFVAGTVMLIAPGSMFVVRQMSSPILRFEDAGAKGLQVFTAQAHPWKTGDKVFLRGIGLTAFDETKPVTLTVENPKAFYLLSSGIPAGHTAPDAVVYTSASYFLHQSAHPVPPAGTMIEITMDGKTQRARVLSGMTGADGISSWLLDQPMFSVKNGTGLVRWSVSGSHLVRRRLFRTGTTGEWRLVAELPMDVMTFRDSVPDSQLGEVIATYYQNSRGFVVYDAPPRDLSGIRSHAGALWGISGNTVRASEPGFPGAWPDLYQWSFSSRPQRIESYNGALIVFCSDAIYRIDGDSPEHAVLSVTQATDGCMAPASVVVASGRIFYIGRTGLMAFDGNHAVPVAHGRIPDGFWRMPSVYSEIDAGESIGHNTVIPTRHTAAYQRIAEYPVIHETGMSDVREILGPCVNLAAFYSGGKYVAYWRALDTEFSGHGCVIVDLMDPKTPVTTSGLRILDAFVDEYETPWLMLQAARDIRLNAFAMGYTTDYPNTPYTPEGVYDPWNKTYFYGPVRTEDLEQLPREVWITTRRGHAQFTLMHTRIRDGEPLNPELGEDTEYVVTVTPAPPAGTWVVEQARNINNTLPNTVFRVLKVALGHGGNSDNPIELPEGDFTIEISCKLDPAKRAKAIVHVTKDWSVKGEEFEGVAVPEAERTLRFISDVPIEPGVSINKLTMRAWPTVDFGGTVGVWEDQALVDKLRLWFEPVEGATNGSVDFGIEHITTTDTVFPARFTDSRAIYTTNFGGVRKQFAFYTINSTIQVDARWPDFAPSSAIPGTAPGMTWHQTAKGEVYAAGGVKDAYVEGWSTNSLPVNNCKGQDILDSVAITSHPASTAAERNAGYGLWKIGSYGTGSGTPDGEGYLMGPEGVRILAASTLSEGTKSPDEPGCWGWSLGNDGLTAILKFDPAERRMVKLGDVGEPKIRPVLNENVATGELHILGGTCYLQTQSYGTRKANYRTSASCEEGEPTAEMLEYPACGTVCHGVDGMKTVAVGDGGQDSRTGSWYAGRREEGIVKDASGTEYTAGPVFRMRRRWPEHWHPSILSKTGPDGVLRDVELNADGQPTNYNSIGVSFHMLDGRVIR